ncbi:hypothetical protein CAOG_02118 [Capsaspora owczarzaki ATCC 30864]|uniref:Transcription factor CBF/NF-Y/archaeal histone domain-containing protein n=1 Tax=Capsaspora owczarzaki (strain ATCC 30864) TaxID=595528 RepID=A0A0D2WKN3_CAPO3|nr:hypothetical protein CAOG_02118 [Capsaspora owczarzaki ATCC 30864]KJE90880.1 hypothetical protein CAOG_002118 [Capsaspora owczarzaki ATCC 30864]|eukprot:XP_004348868.1 hypothetical protein CAOG_02118 [Capsaspora owczarzaki ATCC 30864]
MADLIVGPGDEHDLPRSVLQRLVKEAIADGLSINKDAKTAVTKSATVFILYLTAAANEIAQKANRKTINANDVMAALESVDLAHLQEPLQQELEAFKLAVKDKKSQSAGSNGRSTSAAAGSDEAADDADLVDAFDAPVPPAEAEEDAPVEEPTAMEQ